MNRFYSYLSLLVPVFSISKVATRIVGLLILLLVFNSSVSAQRFAVASGNWGSTTTWSTVLNGAPGASVPGSGDDVTVQTGRTVTLTANAASLSLTNSGSLDISSFTLAVGNIFTNSGTFMPNTGTVIFNRSNVQTIPALTFYNLQTAGNNTKTLGGAVTVSNVLTVGTGTTLALSTHTLTLSGIGTPLIANGGFAPNTSTVVFNANGNQTIPALAYHNLQTSNAGIKTLAGTTTVSNIATIDLGTMLELGSQTLNLAAGSGISPLIINGTFSSSTSTVNYNGANGAIITAANYYNLSSINNNRTLASAGTVGIANIFTPGTGTYTFAGSTVNFNGISNQNIPGFTFNNLQTSGAGLKSLAGTVTVGSVLTLGNSTTLDLNNRTLNLTGGGTPLVVAGTLNAGTSTVNYSGAGATNITAVDYFNLNITGGARTLAGAGTIRISSAFAPGVGPFIIAGSIVNFNGGDGQIIPAFNYFNLSSTNNARTLAGAGIIAIANNFTPGTGTYTLTGSTVSFNGSVNQSIPAFTYNNLNTATAGIKSLGGTVTVNNVLNVGSSTTLELGAQTLNLAGTSPLSVSGFFSASTSTVNYSGGANTNIAAVNYNNLTSTNTNSRILPNGATIGIANIFTPNTGSYTITGSTVNFNGTTGVQTFTPAFSFNNLSISNSLGLNIGSSITVNASLQFNSGRINTGANTVFLANGASVGGAGTGKYVNGFLRKGISAGLPGINFEVGDNNFYTPVSLTFSGTTNATGNITVNTTGNDHPQIGNSEINSSLTANRFWTLTNSGVNGFTSYNATFNYNSADLDGAAVPSSFIVNRYVPSTWVTPALGTVGATSTQAIGLAATEFGDFQLGQAAPALSACGFNDNLSSGINFTPCITNITLVNGSDSVVSNTFSANQYFTLEVIRGMVYQVYTSNGINPASPLTISIYDEAFPANAPIAFSASNTGNGVVGANNVFVSFTSPISGRLRVLINKRRDCTATLPNGLSVRARITGGSNTQDNQLTAGTDSWIGHVYDGRNTTIPFNGTFSNYLGYTTQAENFDQNFGGDDVCYPLNSDGNNRVRILTDEFAVRYRMNSTKRGLYIADISSDDGTRLAVDGTQVYTYNTDYNAGQAYTTRPRVLFGLNGSSNLVLDYYEGGGGNRVSFLNLTQVLGNQLSTNNNQTICQGSAVAPISGDVFGTLPGGITLPAYQWSYATTPTGPRTNITGATGATFTPSTSLAPFNIAGTYYIFRNASLRSANNISPNPYNATNESNAAVLVVDASAPIHTITAASSTFCYANSTNIILSSSTVGVSYQLRNNTGNLNIGMPVAGTGSSINLPTGALFATTTFNVLATNNSTSCTISMNGSPTVATTPNGAKTLIASPATVCVGNSSSIIISNSDIGVRYLLRNNFNNSAVGDSVNGNGGNATLPIPIGYLVSTTTFNVIARDVATNCFGQLVNLVTVATQNLPSPAFEIEPDFCSIGAGNVILATTDSSFSSFLWSNGSVNPSIIINQSGFYSLTVTNSNGCRTTKSINIGDEKVINGDFSQGPGIGYSTGYILNQSANGLVSPGIGYYAINPNANFTHSNFWGRDHSSQTGNFMIINGDDLISIWETSVNVAPNTRYYFSAWAMSVNNAGPFAQLQFNINGVLSGTSPVLPAGVNNNSNAGWQRFFGTWDSGPLSGPISIKIVNLEGASGGNDFGLDDVSFSTLPPVTFFGATAGNGGNNLCLNDTLKLTATLAGGSNPVNYLWKGPGGYTSTEGNPVIQNAPGGWYYLTATEGRNCQSKDSIFIILSNPAVTGVRQVGKCELAVNIGLSGMVPNSVNNTVYYTLNNGAVRVAANIISDALGNAVFTPSPVLGTSNNNQTLRITGIFNGSCTINFSTPPQMVLDIKSNSTGWVGGTIGNWNDIYNWCPSVPTAGTDAFIPTGVTVFINEAESGSARDITLQGTARLELRSNAVFNLHRNFVVASTGKIDARRGIVVTNGNNSAQNLSGDYFVDKSVSTLILNNVGANRQVTIIGDSLKILSALLFGNSDADLETGNKLVLSSSDTATARVGVIAGNAMQNVITGNFIVERSLINAAKWRLLTAPTNRTGQTVRNSWQESGNNIPGFGFIAADPRWTSANTYGFDQRGGNSSVKKYNSNTSLWEAVATTNIDTIGAERGYFVFVQGDRSNVFPATNATKLRTAGTINRGTLPSIPVPANKFMVIGNPYSSRIDIRNINRTNTDTSIFVWDPSLGGNYGLGQFNTLFKDGPNYRNLLPSGIYGPAFSPANFLESGMAFMVKGSSVTGSIVFEENDKAVGSLQAEFAPGDAHVLQATLKLAPQGNNAAIVLDGVMASFDELFSNEVDGNDTKKIGYTGETTGWKTADSAIVIDRRSTPVDNDTLHLQMVQMRAQNYQWELKLNNMDYPGLEAYLVDRFRATSTLLNMTGTATINFNVQNIPGSYAADRFKIVFRTAAVLPVTITTVTATRKSDQSVLVKWKTEQELHMQGYEVERSTDGRNFTSIAVQAPNNNAGGRTNYSSIDGQAPAGDLFYRIKANSLSGQVQYSAVVKVARIKTAALVKVVPNPVTGKQLNVRFTGMELGPVRLVLVNAAGQVIHSSILMIGSNNLTESIPLSGAIAAGRYQLITTSAGGFKNTQQVVIQ